MAACLNSVVGNRRRLFWATQPDACGSNESCGYQCGVPGLKKKEDGSGYVTTDWIRGLIINMMMTDGLVPATACGVRPGAQGGHWSESYITQGPASIGTLVRTVPPVGRVQEGVNMAVAYARVTLERLVARGVALSVDVTGKYVGDGRVDLLVVAYGTSDGETRVQLSGARMANGWIWS